MIANPTHASMLKTALTSKETTAVFANRDGRGKPAMKVSINVQIPF